MTDNAKLQMLKTLLDPDGIGGLPSDNTLNMYLGIAGEEILNWMYSRVGRPVEAVTVPTEYEQVQVMACVSAINIIGAEGQTLHIENGVHRGFVYEDLLHYIHAHVFPYVKVG